MRIRFDSPFYRAWSALADTVILSVLTLAACLPVVTAGASLVACARVAGEMAREQDPAVVRRWWRSFRGNLVESLGWWLPVVVLAVLAAGMNLWLVQAGGVTGVGGGPGEVGSVGTTTDAAGMETGMAPGVVSPVLAAGLRGLVAAGGVMVLGLLIWLTPLVAFFENTVRRHVANAARLAVGYLGRTLGCVVLVLALPVLAWWLVGQGVVPALVAGWFLVLLGPGLMAYVVALVQRPVLDALR